MSIKSWWAAGALAVLASASLAAEGDKDTRGGNCEEAKSQHEYFCDRKGNPNDIMMNAPIACENAKRNMAAACEGKTEADASYKFDEHGRVTPEKK